jgi:hypothetical protein
MRSRFGANGARCNARAAATASDARAERRHKTVPLTLLDRAHTAMGGDDIGGRRAIAAVISSGWVSHSRVEPSTSAKSSVTVPVGKSPLTPRSLQFTSAVSHGSISLMLASVRPPRATKHQRKRADCSRLHAYLRPLSAPI